VFIEFQKRIRLLERAKHYLIQKPLYDTLDFFEEAYRCIEETDCPNILVWGSMRPIPSLRWRFPDRVIAYGQRYFEHSYEVSEYYSYCDILLTQTVGTARFAFEKHYAIPPLLVEIPNGVELDLFHPAGPERRSELREQIGVPRDKFLVLWPSKLHPNKGMAYLLHWIQHFDKAQPKVHFLVVGDWNLGKARGNSKRLLSLLESADNVTWLRGVKRKDMPPLYQMSDVCLMPGVMREGMSMCALEALASGLPLIATARGTYPEIVEHEYNGLLCAPEQLYREGILTIQRLLDDSHLRAALGRNARRYAEMRLSRERCLNNFHAFFEGRLMDIDSDLSPPERARIG
jgi:glycosyltransferase involved in cell wall biosynthesis